MVLCVYLRGCSEFKRASNALMYVMGKTGSKACECVWYKTIPDGTEHPMYECISVSVVRVIFRTE